MHKISTWSYFQFAKVGDKMSASGVIVNLCTDFSSSYIILAAELS